MSARASLVNRLTVIAFFILSGCFLFFSSPFALVFKEQTVLFEFSREYIREIFSKPAAIAELAGTFLTQFFILRWAAVIITLLCVLLLWDGMRRALKLAGAENHLLLALAPAAAEIVLNCQYEYPVSMTIGAAIAVWMALGCLKFKKNKAGSVICAVCALACYPIAGIHCLLFFIIIWAGWGRKPLAGLGLLALSAALVIGYGKMYLMSTEQAFAYPLITGSAIGNVYTLFATEIFAVICFIAAGMHFQAWALSAFVLLCTGSALFLSRDSKTQYELKITTMAYFGKWDTVRRMGKENVYKSQLGAYYYNVALAMDGELSLGLMDAYQPLFSGLFLPVETKVGYPKYIASADALLLCGDYSQAQHSILTGMTFTPHSRSSRAARKLAEIAIYDGDEAVAEKYLDMLSNTVMHRKWALETLEMLGNGQTYRTNHNREMLVKANDFEPALRNIIESGDIHGATAIEYLLCLDLLKKQSKEFIADFRKYYLPNNAGKPIPKLYMEALAMLGLGEAYGVPEGIVAACNEFMSGAHKKYKDTYWYYLLYAQPGE